MMHLPDFSNDHVLVIGDVMLDQYIYGTVERISPEAPVPVMLRGKTSLKAGGAANVALNLKALGARPILLGVVGRDLSGDRLLDVLDKEGLDTRFIIRSEAETTTVKTRLIAGSQHLLRIDEENACPVEELIEHKLAISLVDIIESFPIRGILVEDYNKGLMTPGLIRQIGIIARERHLFVAVDPKYLHFMEYRDFDLIKPNLREVNQVLNHPYEANLMDLTEASTRLREAMKCKNLMITLGEHGIFIDDGTDAQIMPASPIEIVDVCGAGDAVFSLSGLCMMHGMSLASAAGWANRAGSIVCRHPGVVAVHREDLLKDSPEPN